MRVGYYDLTVKCMLLIALTTLFTGLGIVSPVNRFMIALLLITQVLLMLRRVSKKSFGCLIFLLITTVYALINTSWPIENINELFYFPMWVLLINNFIDHYDGFIKAVRRNTGFMKGICILWNVSVFVSLFMGTSYTQKSAFRSFAGAPHRFATGALLIIALVALIYKITGDYKAWILAVLPCITTFLTGARTYMAVVGIVAIMIYYWMTKQKTAFYLTVFPIIAVALFVIMNSSIMVNRAEEIDRLTGVFGGDALGALTSGRSIWWAIDLASIRRSPFLNQLLGNGFHFIRYINETVYGQNIWAHNDYIQLLGTTGIISVVLYFYVYFRFSSFIYSKAFSSKRKMLFVGFHAMNFVNAMFNMLYTYTCAMFAMVLFAVAFFDEEDLGEVKLIINTKEKTENIRGTV